MRRPRKAIILAAGFGSRLLPLTLDCPKPLVPLHGKPMILHQMELLQSWGVKELLINVHHQAEILVETLLRICPAGVKLNLSFEPEILGTGGGLRRMAWFVGEDPVWVCNADVVQRLNPKPLLDAWEKHRPLACLWMIPGKGPQTVSVKRGRVVDFRSTGMTFSGLHLLNRATLEYVPDTKFSSIIEAYDRILAEGGVIRGVEVTGSEWADVGTPEQLLDAENGPVVFPGAEVLNPVKLQRAIVGPGATLRRGTVTGLVVSPGRGLTPAEAKKLPGVEAVGILPVRGSDRSFRRLYFSGHTEILISSGEGRPENLRFVTHTRFLAKKGIRVPVLIESAANRKTLRVEDLGSEHLLDRLQTGTSQRNRKDMREVIKQVAAFHALKVPASLSLEAPFDPKLYQWERELFENEYIKRHGEVSVIRKFHKKIFRLSDVLLAQPQVLVHRDLQSTNVMRQPPESRVYAEVSPVSFKTRAAEPKASQPGRKRPLKLPRKRGTPASSWVLIDYQGMRMGAAAYDLGSLFADPYVNRSPAEQLELLQVYNRVAVQSVNAEVYAAGAAQRLLQALGAYGRLGALKGNERFLEHIPAALAQLEYWAGVFFEGQSAGNSL